MRGAGRGRRALTVAGALVLAGLGLAACGIPTQATARAIRLNPKVNAPPPVTSTTAKPTRAGLLPLTVFFISGGAYLTHVPRYVKPPASVTTALDSLLAGPTTRELYSQGLTTALGSDIKLIHANRIGTVVTVNFTAAFGALSSNQEIQGVAQVVFTVSEALGGSTPSSVGVLFEIDGRTIPVPVATGGLVSSPVHESDYDSLVPPTTTATTTTTTAAP